MSRFFSLISTLNRCWKDPRAKAMLVGLVMWFVGAASLWYWLPYQPRLILPGTEDSAVAGFSPDGNILATKANTLYFGGGGQGNGPIRLWNLHTGKEIGAYSTKGKFVKQLQLSSEGRILAIGSLPLVGGLTIIDCKTNEELAELDLLDLSQFHLTPDGKYLFFDPSGSGDVKIWDISAGQQRPMSDFSPDSYSPDGQWLLSWDSANKLHVREFATGLIRTTIKNDRSLHGLVISNDGKMIAGDGITHTKLWDAETGEELVCLERATRPRFSRNGKRLTVRYPESGGPSFKLWNTTNWKEQTQFQFRGSGWNPPSVLAGPGPEDLSLAVTGENGGGLPSLPIWMTRFLGIRVSDTYTTFHELKVFDIASGKELANYSTEQQIHLAPDARSFVLDSSGYLPPNQTRKCIAVFDIPLRRPIGSIVLWPLPLAFVGMVIFWLFIIGRSKKVNVDKSLEIIA
jgi:WD40 repeat protein